MKPLRPKLVAVLLGLFSSASVFAGLADGTLDIYWVDVEGGGATLIVTPKGESVLIDVENNTADEFIANLDEKCLANYIKLTVAPDANSYTLSIPATGHTRTYETRAK